MAYQKALEIKERLVRDNPTVPKYQSQLAGGHNNIGVSYMKAENPRVTAYQSSLGASYNNIGNVLKDTGKPNEALEAYRKACDIWERLAKENPNILGFKISLGGYWVNMGELAQDTSKFKKADKFFLRGVEVLSQVLSSNPKNATGRRFLCNAHDGRAELMDKLKRYEEAVTEWEQSIEYDSESKKKEFEQRRDAAIARMKGMPVLAPLPKSDKKQKPLVAPRPRSRESEPRESTSGPFNRARQNKLHRILVDWDFPKSKNLPELRHFLIMAIS